MRPILRICKLVSLTFAVIIVMILLMMPRVSPAHAQTSEATQTPSATRTLAFGQPQKGLIALSSGVTDFRFELPHDRDVVIVLKADKQVQIETCLAYKVNVVNGDRGANCNGGGEYNDQVDAPTYTLLFLPAESDPRRVTTYDLQVSRAGPSQAVYTLTGYTLKAKPITFDQGMDGAGSTSSPFAVYTFSGESTDFITAVLQDSQNDGSFLWVNRLLTSSDPSTQAQHSDNAHQDIGKSGVSDLELLYVPETKTYHLLAGGIGNYNLNIIRNGVANLSGTQTLTQSYNNPISIIGMTGLQSGQDIKIRVNSVNGNGMRISAIQNDAEIKTLDVTSQNAPQTLDFTAPTSDPLYIVAQILPQTDRKPVTFDMELVQPAP